MTKRSKQRTNNKLLIRKRTANKSDPANKNYTSLQFISYEITDEPIDDSSIPEEVQDELEDLFVRIQKAPESTIDRLDELISKYPKVPQLYNYISVAYSNLNDTEKSRQYAEKNYNNNPDYLFAKLNYAEICMTEGKYKKVPEILDYKFDIKALYPERDIFHITEVVGFMGIAGSYFANTGEGEQVKLFYKNLKKLAPRHPYTKRLKRYLFINSFRKGLNILTGKK
ncbi:MAG: hypothetical protein ABIK92_03760 [Pseudomonadota bacterium]